MPVAAHRRITALTHLIIMATKEYFPGIGKIKFEGKESKNPMAFRYYDADKVIMGKKMSEWLKFAMAWWHTLCAEGGDQFGGGTKKFPWNGEADNARAFAVADAVTGAVDGMEGEAFGRVALQGSVTDRIGDLMESVETFSIRVYRRGHDA